MAPAALLDENDVPLIYTKDIHGYYHLGRTAPTQEDILKVSRPLEWKKLMVGLKDSDQESEESKAKAEAEAAAKEKEEEQYSVYSNHTSKIQQMISDFKKAGKVEKENIR